MSSVCVPYGLRRADSSPETNGHGGRMCKARCGKRKKQTVTLLLTASIAAAHLLTGVPAFLSRGSSDGEQVLSTNPADWLVPRAHAATGSDDGKSIKWTCPMHPHYIADEFGACPICGMDLVKLETGDDPLAGASSESRTEITVAPEVIQNIGVRLAKAEASTFGRTVRSFGIVRENERLKTDVTARVEGWVEKLNVTAVGDDVEEGTLLFELYSPQLIVSQNDYLRSQYSRDISKRGLTQLRSFGVQQKALDQIKERKRPMERVPFYADRRGTIAELHLNQGTYVKRGMMLARIQDYSTVWLIVSVAEKDLGFINRKTSATVSFPNLPGQDVTAAVDYVYPTIDSQTRTGQVRLILENPDGLIRPGSYADVAFEVGSEQRTAVPTEAVLKNGDGRFVVVSLGGGRFEPRLVETGLATGRWTEIKQGVDAGEEIVVSGQFLLDSESALRESFRKLEKLQMPLSLLDLDKTEFAMIDHMVDAAIYIHEALIDGYDIAPKFLDPAISIRDLMWPKYKNTKLSFVLNDAAEALRAAQTARSESELRATLETLVSALRPWLLGGAPDHYKERKVAFFKEADSTRVWLQLEGKPLNPYGDGGSQQVPWPEKVASGDTGSDASSGVMDARASEAPAPDAPRGSHGDRGSHSGQ